MMDVKKGLEEAKDLNLQSEKLHAKTVLVIDYLSQMQMRRSKTVKQ